VEYTGEVIPEKDRWERMMTARKRGAVHFYIMELSKGMYIDAEHFGSNARFMNSSCDPNCETQKWKDASTGAPPLSVLHTVASRLYGPL
jgi:SET domain-containing protein